MAIRPAPVRTAPSTRGQPDPGSSFCSVETGYSLWRILTKTPRKSEFLQNRTMYQLARFFILDEEAAYLPPLWRANSVVGQALAGILTGPVEQVAPHSQTPSEVPPLDRLDYNKCLAWQPSARPWSRSRCR